MVERISILAAIFGIVALVYASLELAFRLGKAAGCGL